MLSGVQKRHQAALHSACSLQAAGQDSTSAALLQVDEQAAAAVGLDEWAAAADAGTGPTQESVDAFLEGPYSTTMDALAAAEATGDPAVLSAAEGACAEVQAELDSMLAGEADSPDHEVEAGGRAAGDAPEITASAAERVATLAGGARQALPEWAVQTMREVQDIQTGLQTLQQQLAGRSGAAQGPPEQLRLPPAAAASDGLHGTDAASAGPAAAAASGGRSGAAAASSSTAEVANASPRRPDTAVVRLAMVRRARNPDVLDVAVTRSRFTATEGREPLAPPADQPAITDQPAIAPAGLPGSAAATGASQRARPAPQRAQRSNRQQQPPEPIVRWPPGNRQSRVLVLPRSHMGSGRPLAWGRQQEGRPAAAHPQAGQPAAEQSGAASPRPAAAAAGTVLPQGVAEAAARSAREGSPHRRRRPAAAAAAGGGDEVPARGGSGAAAASRSGGSPRRRRRRAPAAAAAAGDSFLAEGSDGAAPATDQLRGGSRPRRRHREHGAAAAASADAPLEWGDEGAAAGPEHSEREGQLASHRGRRASSTRRQPEPSAAADAGQGADHGVDAHRHRWQLPPSGYGARTAGSPRERWQPTSRADNGDEGAPQALTLHLNHPEAGAWRVSAAEHDWLNTEHDWSNTEHDWLNSGLGLRDRAGQRGGGPHLLAIDLRPGTCQPTSMGPLDRVATACCCLLDRLLQATCRVQPPYSSASTMQPAACHAS